MTPALVGSAALLVPAAMTILLVVVPAVRADPTPGATPERAIPILRAIAVVGLLVAGACGWVARRVRAGSLLPGATLAMLALLSLVASIFLLGPAFGYGSHGPSLVGASRLLFAGAAAHLASVGLIVAVLVRGAAAMPRYPEAWVAGGWSIGAALTAGGVMIVVGSAFGRIGGFGAGDALAFVLYVAITAGACLLISRWHPHHAWLVTVVCNLPGFAAILDASLWQRSPTSEARWGCLCAGWLLSAAAALTGARLGRERGKRPGPVTPSPGSTPDGTEDAPPDKSSEEVIFAAAAALALAEREDFLDRACGVDADLRRRVGLLLRAHESAGDFLESPAEDGAAPMAPRPCEAGAEKPGDRIGRYRLLERIGEGGCGMVWMAEQEQPIRRAVALKVIKAGMDTREVIARFESERQALALMDHPNIARVFDAGATPVGRPFFVMELVRGVRITDFCDEHRLTTPQRLELFSQVCHAVQHAHQKGVIHRDLKPSNILVTQHDGAPVPKVIDFGIAKATQGRLTDLTVFTAFAQFIGTPAYMSPEQAEMTAQDVDTRTDIYSLGVLLYELLTGQPPLDAETLARAGCDGVRRMLREKDPPRPSARLRTLSPDTITTAARRRATEPVRLIRMIDGDLDWIVMRCLEKKRTRRYETANELASEIERHLRHEPVSARPPSTGYRIAKFVRRNRAVVIASAAVAAALVAGTGTATWMYLREKAARERAAAAERAESDLRLQAEAARGQAETQAAKSREVARFLSDMLESVGPSVALGRDTTLLREILQKCEARAEQGLHDQPAVEADLLSVMGRVYHELGDFPRAEQLLRRCLELRRRTRGDDDAETAAAMSDLGDTLTRQGKADEAEALIKHAIAVQEHHSGRESLDVALSLFRAGKVSDLRRRFDEAAVFLRESLAIRRRLLGAAHPEIAVTLQALGRALYRAGETAGGERLLRESLDMRRSLYGGEHPAVAEAMWELAVVLNRQLRPTESEPILRQALAMQRRMLGETHQMIAATLIELATSLRIRSDRVEREQCLRDALAIQKRIWPDGHPDMIGTLQELALLCGGAGRHADAETCMREAVGIARQHLGVDNVMYVQALHRLGDSIAEQGVRIAEVESLMREALAIEERTGRAGEFIAHITLNRLGRVAASNRNFPEAETCFRRELDILRAVKAGPVDIHPALMDLASLLDRQGRHEEALELYRETLAVNRTLRTSNPQMAAKLINNVAWMLYLRGHFDEAVSAAEDLQRLVRPRLDAGDLSAVPALDTIACIFEARGRQAEALALFRDAATLTARSADPDDPRVLRTLARLAEALIDAGQLTEAEPLVIRAVEISRTGPRLPGPELPAGLAELGRLMLARGDHVSAETSLREALALYEADPRSGWRHAHVQSMLGAALLGQEKTAEAEPLLRAGAGTLRQRAADMSAWDRRHADAAIRRVIGFCRDHGHADEALEWERCLR